jgi:Methionine synthase I, cobalamin-binding domain
MSAFVISMRIERSTPLISLEAARANRESIDWTNSQPVKPKFIGRRVFKNYSLAEIAKFIDWTPFFLDLGSRG